MPSNRQYDTNFGFIASVVFLVGWGGEGMGVSTLYDPRIHLGAPKNIVCPS